MAVNGIVDSFSVQNTAAALNQLAAAELRQIDQNQTKDDQKRIDDENYTQKLLDGKSEDKSSKQLLGDLVNKLVGSGIKLNAESFVSKAKSAGKDEYDMMLQNNENSDDSVQINDLKQIVSGPKRLNHNLRDGRGGQDPNAPLDTQKMASAISEFSGAFAEFLISGGADLKKKVEQMEARLRSEGLSDQDLLSLKQNIRLSIRGQLANEIKESMLKRFFSKEKTLEWMMNDREGNKTIEFIWNSNKLGSYDYGGYNKHLQGAVDAKTDEMHGEIRDFVKDELRGTLIRKHLSDPAEGKKIDAEIKQLLELGMKAGLNPNTLARDWQKTLIHLGGVEVPPEAYQQSLLGSGMQNGKQQQERTGYEYTQDDEKELLINQLRAAYMQRAVRGDLRTQISTAFHIRKLKNGLIKLAVSFADFDKLEMEGTALARMKVLDMLKEALHERATLYEVAGPAYALIEKKIKGLIKSLERLGWQLDKTEFESLRDQANRAMFDTARFELENTIILYEGTPYPYLERRINLIIKLLKRLREESEIETDFDPETRFASIRQAA